MMKVNVRLVGSLVLLLPSRTGIAGTSAVVTHDPIFTATSLELHHTTSLEFHSGPSLSNRPVRARCVRSILTALAHTASKLMSRSYRWAMRVSSSASLERLDGGKNEEKGKCNIHNELEC